MNRKKKEGLHGIGLKNVEQVITSYGGNYSIKKYRENLLRLFYSGWKNRESSS